MPAIWHPSLNPAKFPRPSCDSTAARSVVDRASGDGGGSSTPKPPCAFWSTCREFLERPVLIPPTVNTEEMVTKSVAAVGVTLSRTLPSSTSHTSLGSTDAVFLKVRRQSADERPMLHILVGTF